MIIWTTLNTAFLQLGSNKMRTGLTMLGIIIGVGAVITLMAAGQGAQKEVTDRVRGLGSNLLFIRPEATQQGRAGGTSQGAAQIVSLNTDDAEAMRDRSLFPDVEAVTAQVTIGGQLIGNGRNVATIITGTDEYYEAVRGFEVAYGSFVTTEDVQGRALNIVLGDQVAKTLFDSPDAAVGQLVRLSIGNQSLNLAVVGVMEERGSASGNNEDDQVFLPLSTVQARVPFLRDPRGRQNVQQITLKVSRGSRLAQTQESIRQLMLERHGGTEDFSVRTQNDLLETANEVTNTLTLLLGAIAGISLVVGGIGIMNIMLVSVAERTREIGILKAVGARRADVMRQFIIESLMVTVAGGLIGVLGGVAVAKVVDGQTFGATSEVHAVVTPLSIAIAFGVSAFIGLFFGSYPAFRASRLDPIVALRTE